MKTRTWKYGTTRTAKVIASGTGVNLVEDCEGEGHVLMNGAQDDKAQLGDIGNLVFTEGGPTGGYWKFTVPQRWKLEDCV